VRHLHHLRAKIANLVFVVAWLGTLQANVTLNPYPTRLCTCRQLAKLLSNSPSCVFVVSDLGILHHHVMLLLGVMGLFLNHLHLAVILQNVATVARRLATLLSIVQRNRHKRTNTIQTVVQVNLHRKLTRKRALPIVETMSRQNPNLSNRRCRFS